MSMETTEWLNQFVLIGQTDKRGKAWHYRESAQGAEPNHYTGFIPVPDVLRRLFGWEAVEKPVFQMIDKKYRPIPDKKLIVRSDDEECILGIFSEGYVPHPYAKWLLEVAASILGSELGISSAGLLQKGGLAWVEVSMPENIKTPEGVEFRANFLAGSSFNGTLSTTYKKTNSITVCDNTLAVSLASEGEEIKIKHTKESGVRVNEAREAMNIIVESAEKFRADISTLCKIPVSAKEFEAVLNAYVPIPEASGRGATMAQTKRETLEQLYKNDSRVAPWTGTAFGVLQMDNTYRHHYQIVRGADGGHAERNAENALLGRTGDADAAILNILAGVKGQKVLVAA